MKVAVCIITYQRQEGLKRLLEGLNNLAFEKCKAPALEVIVVDNDATGSARKFCEETRLDSSWSLKYFIEPRRGIPYARNKAVACAQEGHPDFIAFIDDDEVPERSWLDELLSVQQSYRADVVAGPVLPYFTGPVAPWVTQGKFFHRRRMPTGTTIEWAGTGNVLVRSEVFEKMGEILGEIFDERLALSGGEDERFFRQVHSFGYKLVWAQEALAYEWLPKSRANARWLLRRAYRSGNNYSRFIATLGPTGFDVEPSIAARANRAWQVTKRTIKELLELRRSLVIRRHGRPFVTFKPRSEVERSESIDDNRFVVRLRADIRFVAHVNPRRDKFVRGLLRVSYNVGMLTGLVGVGYKEYRRTHRV